MATKGYQQSSGSTKYAYERFVRSRQIRQLLVKGLGRWLVTAILVASIYGVLWSYSSKSAMVESKKREFSAVIIGLSITLGLHIASALKANIGELRWWLLSISQSSPREADLILRSESLRKLAKLGWESRRSMIRLYVLVWLLISLASEVAVATIGLTYNINPADRFTITRPGNVAIPELSDIQTSKVISSKSAPQALSALRYTANSYGLVALSYGIGTFDDIPKPGTVYDPNKNLVYCDRKTCRYYFYEATPDNLDYYQNVVTDRYAFANATCSSWPVLTGGDGFHDNITIGDGEETTFGPLPALNGPNQTLYMNDPESSSGNSWSIVEAFEASLTDPWFYRCNITVGPVINSIIQQHELGANVSRLAAPAIALQGYGVSNSGLPNSTIKPYQFQSYPAGSFYGYTYRGNTTIIGSSMALFAAGVIAVTAQANSNIIAPGLVPIEAITIEIKRWEYVHLILLLTLASQLLFSIVSVFYASRVQVRGHSFLAMAILLRPILHGVGHRALAANGSQIASMLEPSARLSYVPERGGAYHVQKNNSVTDH